MEKIQLKKKKNVHRLLIVNPWKMFCPTLGTDLSLMKAVLTKTEKGITEEALFAMLSSI